MACILASVFEFWQSWKSGLGESTCGVWEVVTVGEEMAAGVVVGWRI